MDIAGKARKIERTLARTVDAAIGELVGRDEPAPLEIVHAVLDRAEHQVQDVGRGRRIFPFNAVRVQVVAAAKDKEAKARFDAVVAGPPSLDDRLRDRLRSAGCGDVHVVTDVVYVKQRGDDWDDPRFHVAFDRVARAPVEPLPPPAAAAPVEAPRLKLTVVKGSADQRAYAFTGGRIDIGRRTEVVDQKQRLIRTNQIAFTEEGADENRTVSRRHAHIEFVDTGGYYRIYDDRSTHGTSIVRGGRTIKVPAGTRGARLEAGDEIALGYARLKVAIETNRGR
jgi:hypothetical protein